MRENTGRLIITTVNFGDGHYGNEYAATEWSQAEVTEAYEQTNVIRVYADQHEQNRHDVEYVEDFGYPQVFEYQEAGLRVVALMHDGKVSTVFSVEDADTARLHTAARTGRRLSIRYVKPSGEVSRRSLSVTSVSLTKAGHVTVRATDLKIDEGRSFRADRITHTTLHRSVTGPAAPSKTALAAEFAVRPVATVTIPAPRPAAEEARTVRLTRSGQTGRTIPGTRALSASGWSVKVELDADDVTASGTVRVSEDDLEPWIVVVTDIYSTDPNSPAALEAPEAVQDQIAERYALGHLYAFITV